MTVLDTQNKNIILALADVIWSRSVLNTIDKTTIVNALNETLLIAKTEVVNFWGKFLLDPDETNGWFDQWMTKDIASWRLWTSINTNFNRKAWWISFPYNVKVKRLHVWHRNSNAAALAWWWVIWQQSKTPNSNVKTNLWILHEVNTNLWVWTRDYLNVKNQLTDIDLSALPNNIILAWDVITLWVSAPTAITTNYYVNVESWYIEFERVA